MGFATLGGGSDVGGLAAGSRAAPGNDPVDAPSRAPVCAPAGAFGASGGTEDGAVDHAALLRRSLRAAFATPARRCGGDAPDEDAEAGTARLGALLDKLARAGG